MAWWAVADAGPSAVGRGPGTCGSLLGVPTTTPQVRASLIVLNYEGEAVIGQCIASLLASAGEDDELIVVDNGSLDTSVDILHTFGGQIRLVLLDYNTYIFGLNRGLDVARGEFVAFLNNDMTVEVDFVDRCVDALQSGGDDVFAACPRIIEVRTGADQGSRTAGYWENGLLFYRPLPHVATISDCFFAVGGQSFFRRSYLEEIGSIDPLFWPMYHEDLELSYRAWKRGWRILYVPDAVVHHLGGYSSKKVFSPVQLRSFVKQNELLMVWKNFTDRRLIVQHVALLLPRLALALVRGDVATLMGFRAAVARAPQALRARRQAKRHFRRSDAEVLALVGGIR